MRLHPVEDGLIPEPQERGIRTRDCGGNKLVDITDANGFCVGVRSPMTVPADMPVITSKGVSGSSAPSGANVRFDSERGVYFDMIRSKDSDPVGLVVRLEGDPDGPLACTRIRVISGTKPIKPGSSAPVRSAPSARSANDAAVKAVLQALGYTGRVTKQVRTAILDMIQKEKEFPGATGKFKLPKCVTDPQTAS